MGILFLGLSIIAFILKFDYVGFNFILGVMACISVIGFIRNSSNKNIKTMNYLAQYTMPIYLMHTIVAAPTRIILVKLGITNFVLHIFIGIAVSIGGPILITNILRHCKWLYYIINRNGADNGHSNC